MKKNELIKFRELVNNETDRRKRIKELLDNDLVLEYLTLTETKKCNLDFNDIDDIVNRIISNYKITKTNEIYVCTCAYYIDCKICYEDTDYYSKYVNIDSDYAEYKLYTDIESKKYFKASKKNSDVTKYLISDFENNNIVLNPYNTCRKDNGYDEVRTYFFINALKYGQAKSKKLVLSKYPKI